LKINGTITALKKIDSTRHTVIKRFNVDGFLPSSQINALKSKLEADNLDIEYAVDYGEIGVITSIARV